MIDTAKKYDIVFHGSAQKYVVVYAHPDKEKITVLSAFKRFMADYHAFLLNGIQEFWTDNGGEFCNDDMDTYYIQVDPDRNGHVDYHNCKELHVLQT